MLGKLLKYELKATSKIFIPMYIVTILMTLLNVIFIKNQVFIEVQNIIQIVILALYIALTVMTIVVTTERFRKNLLGDEGYLMFTLPVKTSSLIISKLIVSIIWGILSLIVTLISAQIIMNSNITSIGGFLFGENSNFYVGDISISGIELVKNNQDMTMLLCIGVTVLSMYSMFVLIVYNSLAISQLPQFSKRKDLTSIISFSLITIVVILYHNITNTILVNPNMLDNLEFMEAFIKLTMIVACQKIIICIVLFAFLNYILSKKLNLD